MSATRSRAGKRARWPIPVLVLILAAVAATAWWSLGRTAPRPTSLGDLVDPGAAAGFNVLLITLDTTRADRLGCYGYGQDLTPAIDGLLEHGVLFEDAVTSVPITLPAHASLLTGRYPPAIGVRDNGSYRLAPEHVTLPETLKQHGYTTAAFVSCFVLDRRFGLDQGFDLYDFQVTDAGRREPNELRHERPADAVTDEAIGWLRDHEQSPGSAPFFAWVHYFDPHHPYASPLTRQGLFQGHPYDGEIAFVDRELKRLLAALDELQLRDSTLIVLASDHGEALGEHQEKYHGIFVYESTIRVALMLSCPALFDGPTRIDGGVVGLVDVRPTLEELLGLPVSGSIDGQSLVSRHPAADRAIYIESYHPAESLGCSPLYGLRRHRDKYILAPEAEYYDLAGDPGERANRYGAHTLEAEALDGQLEELMGRLLLRSGPTSGGRTPSPEERRRLESLGYVGGGYTSKRDGLPDPKDQIAIINRMTEVTRLSALGRHEQALALAGEVADACDGYDFPIHQLAYLHARAGQPAKAVEVLEAYARRHPSTSIFHHLATHLHTLRRYDEFERALEAAEIIDTDGRGAIPMLRGDHLFEQQRYAEALEQYEQARDLDAVRVGPIIDRKIELTRQRLANPLP